MERGEEEMTSVYVVETGDCESSWIISIHKTREKALVTWNEQRIELIRRAKEMLEFCKTAGEHACSVGTYEREIENLSETDPEKIDNYPHDCVHLTEHELED